MSYLTKIVDISDFRGIRKVSREVPLRKFNVLLGKNNSGKSSILEALFLVSSIQYDEPITGKNVLTLLEERHGGDKRLIYKYSGKATITASKGKESITYSIDSRGRVTDANGKRIKFLSKPAQVIYLPYDTEFMKRISDFLETREAEIVKRKIHTKTAQDISQVIDEEFTEIFLRKDGWYFRKLDASYVHIEDAGDGVKKVAKTMMLVDLLRPKLILWDDFDTALHPSLLKLLLNWLARGSSQVVLSTHSIDVLYYLADLNDELDALDAQVVLLRKNGNDVLHHQELTMDELDDLLEGNVDPRKLVDKLEI